MPGNVVFHEGDVFALHGLRNDCTGFPLYSAGVCKSCLDGVKIVAIDHLHVETKRAELLVDGAGAANLFHRAVDLQAVVVHNQAEIVKLLMGGKHGSLPDLALLDLTVAEDRIHTIRLVIQLGCQRHAAGGRNTLAQGARAHIHAGRVIHIRMTLQHGADMAQRLHLIGREIAALRQRCIQTGAAMAFGEDKTIAVRIMWILRIHLHLFEIEIGKQVRRRKRTAGVT